MSPEEFWSRVDQGDADACWHWTGALSSGYGSVRFLGRVHKAHRAAWGLTHGTMPPSDLCVCHHCDNPPCCNPAHLFLGTKAENNEDKRRKGRGPDTRGTANPNARLSDEDVKRIRDLWEAGMTQTAIGQQFGVAQGWISKLVRYERRVRAEI